jgi:hypothetical protein
VETLAALRDIHPPLAPGWFPPALGWWLLALAGAVVVALLWRRLPKWWRRQRVRRSALAELAAIGRRRRAGASPRSVVADVSALLRRVALSADSRRDVAGLAGDRWLAYLDRRCGEAPGGFTRGPGRCLAEAPYGGPEPEDPAALLSLAARWVRRNAGRRS